MKSAAPHLSALTLDALALGALPAGEAALARAHLETCERCQKDAAEARAARDHFDGVVFRRTLPNLARRRRFRISWRPLTLVLAPTLAAAAVVLLVIPRRTVAPDSGSEIGIKGGPSLQMFARRSGRVFAVADGARLAPGDEVRFAVTPHGLPYLLVVSVDGAGKPNVYFPFAGTQSGRVDADARSELPGSIVLDDAPGPERVFALFSTTPLSAADAMAALRRIGARGAEAIRSQRQLAVAAQTQVSLLFDKSP
jgi:hypothetical protein